MCPELRSSPRYSYVQRSSNNHPPRIEVHDLWAHVVDLVQQDPHQPPPKCGCPCRHRPLSVDRSMLENSWTVNVGPSQPIIPAGSNTSPSGERTASITEIKPDIDLLGEQEVDQVRRNGGDEFHILAVREPLRGSGSALRHLTQPSRTFPSPTVAVDRIEREIGHQTDFDARRPRLRSSCLLHSPVHRFPVIVGPDCAASPPSRCRSRHPAFRRHRP